MKASIIYRNIFIYRFVMNVLYLMKYKKRFYDIISLFNKEDKRVLELCFGDIIIAQECKKRNISWIGYDINEYFVKKAELKGFKAFQADLSTLDSFPKSDVCIMCGSLYHFKDEIGNLLAKMLNSSPKIIISEPIENISSQKGILGKISRFLTNAGKGNENFRFDKTSIIETLDKYSELHHYTFKTISITRDILIEINYDRNQHCSTGL